MRDHFNFKYLHQATDKEEQNRAEMDGLIRMMKGRKSQQRLRKLKEEVKSIGLGKKKQCSSNMYKVNVKIKELE